LAISFYFGIACAIVAAVHTLRRRYEATAPKLPFGVNECNLLVTPVSIRTQRVDTRTSPFWTARTSIAEPNSFGVRTGSQRGYVERFHHA